MKLKEIVEPLDNKKENEMLDYLAGNQETVKSAYDLHALIKKESSFKEVPYVITPRKTYGSDLGAVIDDVQHLIVLLESSGLTKDNQIIGLLNESLDYLKIRR
jgi:hypothetical protein